MASTGTLPAPASTHSESAPVRARLVIEHLHKVYTNGVVALDDLSLELGHGVFGLLGPNGAGKTTLMEILATLLLPSAGRIRFDGIDLLRKPQRIRPLLGYLPQTFGLYPNLTIGQFLGLMGRLYGLGGRRLRARIDEVLERVNLVRLRKRPMRSLSGGEQRRTGIAQALLNEPQLLIVDEPTSGLDPQERLHFRNLLFDLGRKRVVILSTHLVKDVEFSCNDMIVLHHGQAIYRGAPLDLVGRAEGRTWEFAVAPGEFDTVRERFQLVTIRETGEGFYRARVVGDEPPLAQAEAVEPNLEDAYVLLVGGEGRADQ
jgi:ABC-type multidrug transport system ATPase subunit